MAREVPYIVCNPGPHLIATAFINRRSQQVYKNAIRAEFYLSLSETLSGNV